MSIVINALARKLYLAFIGDRGPLIQKGAWKTSVTPPIRFMYADVKLGARLVLHFCCWRTLLLFRAWHGGAVR